MKTINIKGKEYVPVVERVKELHKIDAKAQISTDVVEFGERISVKAIVTLGDGRVFTGHSQAVYKDGMMGDVALEIAETSAVGRALGFANIGLLEGIASADEMRKVKQPAGEKKDGYVEELGF